LWQSAAGCQLIFIGAYWFVIGLHCFVGACQSLKSFFARPFKAMLDSYRYDSLH